MSAGTKHTSHPARTRRIALLIGVVATLGVADLWLTIHFMRTTGMIELNPFARSLAAAGPGALIAFKLASMAIHGAVLVGLRRRASAECAAWVSLVVMLALTAHWIQYVDSAHEMMWADPAVLAADTTFVRIGG